ncbi:Uncharacterised protein (plasmid) [Tsukamurella tyrosinosolvens]|nr:Uncharacterised protein [Tsukamurella tyrosinosolvens]
MPFDTHCNGCSSWFIAPAVASIFVFSSGETPLTIAVRHGPRSLKSKVEAPAAYSAATFSACAFSAAAAFMSLFSDFCRPHSTPKVIDAASSARITTVMTTVVTVAPAVAPAAWARDAAARADALGRRTGAGSSASSKSSSSSTGGAGRFAAAFFAGAFFVVETFSVGASSSTTSSVAPAVSSAASSTVSCTVSSVAAASSARFLSSGVESVTCRVANRVGVRRSGGALLLRRDDHREVRGTVGADRVQRLRE